MNNLKLSIRSKDSQPAKNICFIKKKYWKTTYT
jgi:hypothetical protein